ncbi:1-phosphofructokinase [Acidilutibacter cellobiosedens]|uniref:Tagatose-6-phosphate kinase n=1 Tax=Acidilutibacter cellobiosedens TaxID=2507161 RepID=A0A410QH19_9FIRM|nr:1-phosphofructokinase [Acidilutibacter cellobiosedens]QAT63229.1 1-phosphofructokinase [Acidilutibacter cellobiosedens]
MIWTVTLNPALDKTIEVNNFRIGSVNRASSIRIDAGGKGINVSKMVKTLGGKTKAFGILPGGNGRYIKGYLDRCGIENDFIFTEGETRTNIKVIDSLNHTNTDINEPGVNISYNKIKELEEKIFKGIDKNTLLVLSGSVPNDVPKDIYRRWINISRKFGVRTILDCDGELLKEGIKASPYLMKPNIDELQGLIGREIANINDMVLVSREILKLGVEIVVLSMGFKGALFIKKDCAIHAVGIKVDVKSTVGAGDSMVAALAYALDTGMNFEKAAAYSMAAATAKVTTSGTQMPNFDRIVSIENRIKLNYIK